MGMEIEVHLLQVLKMATHTYMAPDEVAHTQTMDTAFTVQPSNLIIKPHQETRSSHKDNCDDLSRLLLKDQRKPQY